MLGRTAPREPNHAIFTRSRQGGRLYLWSGRALFFGTSVDTASHQHHAVQLSIGLDGPFRLRFSDKSWREYYAVLINSDQAHQLNSLGAPMANLYVAPESEHGRRLSAGLKASASGELAVPAAACLIQQLRILWSQGLSCQRAFNLTNHLLYTLTGFTLGGRPLDPRVARAFKILNALPEPRLLAKELAARVGLSAGRFAHLFREQTGLPVRRYLLWLRLLRAINQLSRIVSLTDAAHEAGFADSAHLTRTFRRMFGITPSEIFRSSQFVQVMACPPLIE